MREDLGDLNDHLLDDFDVRLSSNGESPLSDVFSLSFDWSLDFAIDLSVDLSTAVSAVLSVDLSTSFLAVLPALAFRRDDLVDVAGKLSGGVLADDGVDVGTGDEPSSGLALDDDVDGDDDFVESVGTEGVSDAAGDGVADKSAAVSPEDFAAGTDVVDFAGVEVLEDVEDFGEVADEVVVVRGDVRPVEGVAVEGAAVEAAVEEVDLPAGFEAGNFEVALPEVLSGNCAGAPIFPKDGVNSCGRPSSAPRPYIKSIVLGVEGARNEWSLNTGM